MKTIILFLANALLIFAPDLATVRKYYMAAPRSEDAAMKFAKFVEGVTKDDANKTLVAYKGCSLTLKSKHSNYLPDKISFMKEGAGFMDAAATADPQNVEIRMIRLSVQEHVPFIVNYRDNIEQDKAVIIANYPKLSKDMKLYIKNFVKQSESFSAGEKAKFE